MNDHPSSRLDRIEAAIEQLAAADRRMQERQEVLHERQEALVQSVELLASIHRENETRVAQLMDTMNRLAIS